MKDIIEGLAFAAFGFAAGSLKVMTTFVVWIFAIAFGALSQKGGSKVRWFVSFLLFSAAYFVAARAYDGISVKFQTVIVFLVLGAPGFLLMFVVSRKLAKALPGLEPEVRP